MKRFFTRSCPNGCELPELVTKSHEIRRKIKCTEGEKVEIKFRVKYDNISGIMNHFRPIFDLKCPTIGSSCKYKIVSKRYLVLLYFLGGYHVELKLILYGLFRRKNEFIMKFKFASLSKHDFGAFTLRLWNHSPTPIEIIQLVHNADVVPTRTNSQSKRRMSENQIKYDPGYGAMECMPRKIDRCSGNGFLCINTLTEEGF